MSSQVSSSGPADLLLGQLAELTGDRTLDAAKFGAAAARCANAVWKAHALQGLARVGDR